MNSNFIGVLTSGDYGMSSILDAINRGEWSGLQEYSPDSSLMEEQEGKPEVSIVQEKYGKGLLVRVGLNEEKFVSDVVPTEELYNTSRLLIKQGKRLKPYLDRYTMKYWDSKRGDVSSPVEEGSKISLDGDTYIVESIEGNEVVVKDAEGKAFVVSMEDLTEAKVSEDTREGKIFKSKKTSTYYCVLSDDGGELEVVNSHSKKITVEERDFVTSVIEVKNPSSELKKMFKKWID